MTPNSEPMEIRQDFHVTVPGVTITIIIVIVLVFLIAIILGRYLGQYYNLYHNSCFSGYDRGLFEEKQ